MRRIVGIDLSGKDGNATGIALILDDQLALLTEFRTLDSIIEYLYTLKPNIVAIDAPLSLPKAGAYRDCDLQLKKLGLNPLPLNLWSMKMLIRRAIRLVTFLNKTGTKIIETFPYASLRLLGYRRKPQKNSERQKIIREIARMYGLKIRIDTNSVTKDKFDAFVCAVVGHATTIKKGYKTYGKKCKIYVLSRD